MLEKKWFGFSAVIYFTAEKQKINQTPMAVTEGELSAG